MKPSASANRKAVPPWATHTREPHHDPEASMLDDDEEVNEEDIPITEATHA